MGITYREFYDQGVASIVPGASEFSLRNGVSRSYYGVYHLALAYADLVSVPPVSDCGGPTHRKLSKFFEGSLNADPELRRRLRRLGYCLKQLHDNRVLSDYHLDECISYSLARDHLASCDLRLKEFQELLSVAAA